MSEHTPGPWRVENATNGSKFSGDWREILSGNLAVVTPGSYESSRYGGETICGVHISAANARLIAAAPELLEALDDMLTQFVDLPHAEGCLLVEGSGADIARKQALAAIAKATGEDA